MNRFRSCCSTMSTRTRSHFVPQFRRIHEYVMSAYERAGVLPAPAGPPVQVWTMRGRAAAGHYRMTGLPCFSVR